MNLLRCSFVDKNSPKHEPRRLSYEAFMQRRDSVFTESSKRAEYLNVEKVPIPSGFKGYYRNFVMPDKWSAVFSSAGDFTIKLVSVHVELGATIYRMAVLCSFLICSSTDKVCRGANENNRLNSYVIFVHHSESEFMYLANALVWELPGHFILDRMPQRLSMFSSMSENKLKERGHVMLIKFLAYVVQIEYVGHNRLVPLNTPMIFNPRIRKFLKLPQILQHEDQRLLSSTNSCVARIEIARPNLPNDWCASPQFSTFDLRKTYTTMGANTPKWSQYAANEYYDSPVENFPFVSPNGLTCMVYCPPNEWKDIKDGDGMFTTEVSAMQLVNGHVHYRISTLYWDSNGIHKLEIHRRYTEFYKLAKTLSSKLRQSNIQTYLPPKTIFRSTSPDFIETRSKALQHYLEKILPLTFQGLLGEKILLPAEPNMRTFLGLPKIDWVLAPAHSTKKRHRTFSKESAASPLLSPRSPTQMRGPVRLSRRRSGSF